MDSTFIHDDEEELQAASTNALTEADKRAKAAVVAGGTNTLSNHKLLHPFHVLLSRWIYPSNTVLSQMAAMHKQIVCETSGLIYKLLQLDTRVERY
ncbi:hypothetical protein Tco_0251468 [Tanacetum coccineum]